MGAAAIVIGLVAVVLIANSSDAPHDSQSIGNEPLDSQSGEAGLAREKIQESRGSSRIGSPEVPESGPTQALTRTERWREQYPFELGKPVPNPPVLLRSIATDQGAGLLRDLKFYKDVINPLGIPLTREDAQRIGELASSDIDKLNMILMRRNQIQHEAFMAAEPDPMIFETMEACQAYWSSRYGTVLGNIRQDAKGFRCVPLAPSDGTIEIYLAAAEVIAQSALLADRIRRIIDTGEYQRR